MSLVIPQSEIIFYKNIPLDETYKHTFYFTSKATQQAYFLTKVVKTVNSCSVVKGKNTTIRVECALEDIIGCNYISYKNVGFCDKVFYGFITDISYVNNITCEISFTPDYIQTWICDFIFNECFVVREHSSTDIIGSNVVTENLDLGCYVVDGVNEKLYTDMNICVVSTGIAEGVVDDGIIPDGGTSLVPAPTGDICGIYTPLTVWSFDKYSDANEWVENLVKNGGSGALVRCFMYPSKIGYYQNFMNTGESIITDEFGVDCNFDTIDGYTPRNKKLFTYPFNYITLSNNNGNTVDFFYEDFHNVTSSGVNFQIYIIPYPDPTIVCVPKNHKNLSFNYSNQLTAPCYVDVPMSVDAQASYNATNRNTINMGLLSTVISTGLTTLQGGGVTGVVQGALSVGNVLAQQKDLKNTAPSCIGSTSGASVNACLGRVGLTAYKTCIRYEQAKIIDEFFTMYGYQTNRVKRPNITGRPFFNYVQTIDANVTGNVDKAAIETMKKALNNGITFWHDTTHIFNYSIDNGV